MTTEVKDLLIKDLCARLPYGVKVQVQGWDETKEEEMNIPLKVYSINTDGYVYFEPNDYDVNYLPIENCLLYLRPMLSMTDEEGEELNEHITIYDDVDWMLAHYFDFRGLIEKDLH